MAEFPALRRLAGIACLSLILFESAFRQVSSKGGDSSRISRTPTSNHAQDNNVENTTAKVPQFVFFMGLEGTGHHLIRALGQKSPIFTKLKEMNLTFEMGRLQNGLYNHRNKSNGLWSLPCDAENRYANRPRGARPVARVATLLDSVRQKVENSTSPSISVPLNCVTSGPWSGMMSYPNFLGECSSLQYPDVRLLHESCAAANVTCAFVYLHRDAYEIVRSTTSNRHYHSRSRAIKLYATLSQVLDSQLQDIAPYLRMCHDYAGGKGAWWQLWRLFGWTNRTAFESMLNGTVVRAEPLTDEDRNELVPWELQPYMDQFVHALEQTRETCQSLVSSSSGP